ncbi:MAG: TrkA C-terminal domain-containing protein [Mobiluncus porci]|uniref:aspartate:alanine exchanger family transporter n=1 Tax=Mobiluncus TaxID=2050 RepID=UPI0023F4B5FA|nr:MULTISPECIES: TrkA C-terminal domain-containing protein [Mobiluncus]MCI6584525.1 transporter [Mobiluncus sp.]MDD7540811.1 TrkA C-terminal domain-containing protein [Mobiluncus porci]MDY5749175.1 TrkA C-terminal domain-containing protein [Mobiluncus porci]
MFAYFAVQPVVLLVVLLGIGMAIGHIKIKGVSLGAAAVLFLAIAISAWGKSQGYELSIPKEIAVLGLSLFAFSIGCSSGTSFFATMRTAWKSILVLVAAYIAVSALAVGLGSLLGMSISQIGGTLAGALTNTPMLEAVGEKSGDSVAATVGYSISYLYGVLGMLLFSIFALKSGKNDKDAPSPLVSKTIRVETDSRPRLGDIYERFNEKLAFSRLRRGETGPITRPNMSDTLNKGDLLTIVGEAISVQTIINELGHSSSHSLQTDRTYLDYRRITLSDVSKAGKTISELNMGDRFGATVSRVRRGDVDMVAYPDLVLQLGDRLRVVSPISNITEVTKYLGDSTRGLTSLNPVALGIGMTLGFLVGQIPIPNPAGGTFSVGYAAGILIVGLIMGRIGRIGPFVTTLPYTTGQVIGEIGLLLFLAQAGVNAGGSIQTAFTGGDWWKILLLGIVITTVFGLILFITMRFVTKMGGTKLAGFLGGAQTQPAVLGFANDQTNNDPRVSLGYAMAYPVAMITKILCGTFVGIL